MKTTAALLLLNSKPETIRDIWGDVTVKEIWDTSDPDEIIRRMEEYDAMPVHLGDVVKTNISCNPILVTRVCGEDTFMGIDSEGYAYANVSVNEVKRTGQNKRSILKSLLSIVSHSVEGE